MPFKDTKEGQTHYQNDGCGEPAHNNFIDSRTEKERKEDSKIISETTTSLNKNMKKEKKYNALCSEYNCYEIVKEDDIERDKNGIIYERSKKCWGCRTLQDHKAIKAWRKNKRLA